jgi:NAD(P)-dependent dehydrogenase (short-subunit alcohol dehydrogenase family)
MKKENWTTNNIPDLTGKVIIVTGGNSGLGYESVKAFAEKGAEVILTSRDLKRGEQAKNEIGKTKGKIVVMQLDLASFDSINSFADTFKEKYSRLDILMNNAGIMTTPYFLTKDGLEAQNGVNHYGHFLLTGLLFDLIKSTKGSRVVNVSSNGHKWGKMDFDNPLFEGGKDYSPMKSYSRSKLANLLFTYELQREFEKNRIDSIAVAAHPGASETNLGRHVEDKFWFRLMYPLFKVFGQDQVHGALPQIRASVDANVKGGEYFGPHRGMKGNPVVVKSNGLSHNVEDARKLWEISERLTGFIYNFS